MREIDYSDLQAIGNHVEDCLEQDINTEQALRTLEIMCPQEVRVNHSDVIVEWIKAYQFKDYQTAFWCMWFLEIAIEEEPNDPAKRLIELATD